MNTRAIDFIKNFSYTLSSNLISMVISILMVLVVPRVVGLEVYGYWQIYIFYSSYVGILHLGWNDGIYLRYGGKHYEELNKKLFFSQYYMLGIFQLIIALMISILSITFVDDINRRYIFYMISIALIVTNVRIMLIYILQSTNRIKEFAKITMVDKISYGLLIASLVIFGYKDFKLMIVADLIGKFISLVLATYYCKDIVYRSFSQFSFNLLETTKNIAVGIKLMFSNLASTLILGVVRIGIERTWSVEVFGKISLTLSISNFLLLFINTLGIVIFPILRRTRKDNLPIIYTTLRDFLMLVLLGLLVLYYPIKVILSFWLPQYSESLKYMALLFPMSIFEGKMALLINTYYKTLRKEKEMLKINIAVLLVAVISTFIFTRCMENLNSTILSIIIFLGARSIISEVYLTKVLTIHFKKDIIYELSLVLIFIVTGWFINSWLSTLIYGSFYFLYIMTKRKELSKSRIFLKELVGK